MGEEPETLNIGKLTVEDEITLKKFLDTALPGPPVTKNEEPPLGKKKDTNPPHPRPPVTKDDSPPLGTKRGTPGLDYVDIPLPRPVVDHTKGIDGITPVESGDPKDELSKLTQKQMFDLLNRNKIDLAEEGAGQSGTMQPYILGKTLTSAGSDAVHFARVKVLTPDTTGTTRVGFAHTEFESHLQRQSASAASTNFGIPGIFKVDASYRDASSMFTDSATVRVFFQASQLVPKAKVVFDSADITLAPTFVDRIAKACLGKAEDLLDTLQEYGHFVALTKILGGRMTLDKTTDISDKSQIDARERELTTDADARFAVDGVPLEGGAKLDDKDKEVKISRLTEQALHLHMELTGGNVNLASSKIGTFAEKWMSSLGPSGAWGTVGFPDHSLVPIIDFLPNKIKDKKGDKVIFKSKKKEEITLKEKCKELLRDYFLDKLVARKTGLAGNTNDDSFTHELDIRLIKRIKKIQVCHQTNVDGLRWWFEVHNEASADAIKQAQRAADPHSSGPPSSRPVVIDTGEWIGAHNSSSKRESFELREDEEITAIEAGTDASGGLVKIAFKTNRTRYPSDNGFYGQAQTNKIVKIDAPRVKGFYGHKAVRVHGIGLSYLGLADEDVHSREFLLAMEPYLFSNNDDYGLIK
jgi:hypothetical protein